MRSNLLNVHSLLWMALVLALAGSLKHLATVFAGVDGNQFLGWLQAVAIDAGVLGLSYSLRGRKTNRRSVKPLWLGISLFTGISIYGNLTYGLQHTIGNLPYWITATRPYVLAATLPVLVLYLAEILSDDRQAAIETATVKTVNDQRKPAKSTGNTAIASPSKKALATVNDNKRQTKESRKRQLSILYRQNPDVTVTDLARQLTVSRGTIRNYAAELGLSISGNGKEAQ